MGKGAYSIRALSVALALAIVCNPVPATAQMSSVTASDPYARPGLNYIGSVRLDPARGRIEAGWTIIVEDDTLEHIQFRLNPSLAPMQVSGPGVAGSTLSSRSTDATTYRVDLVPTLTGADRVIKLAYSGTLADISGAPDTAPALPSSLSLSRLDADAVELSVDSLWFPFDARFDTPVTARVSVFIEGGRGPRLAGRRQWACPAGRRAGAHSFHAGPDNDDPCVQATL